ERDLLTPAQFKELSHAPAVMRFWVTRNDIPDAERKKGISFLADRAGVRPMDMLLEIIQGIDTSNPNHGLEGLSKLLMEQDRQDVQKRKERLKELAAATSNRAVREVCFAWLLEVGSDFDEIKSVTELSEEHYRDLLTIIQLVNTNNFKSDIYN